MKRRADETKRAWAKCWELQGDGGSRSQEGVKMLRGLGDKCRVERGGCVAARSAGSNSAGRFENQLV